jgi:hypothetical protein
LSVCGPAALPIIAAGVSAAGTLVQGYSAMQQGKYEAGVARQNAVMERSAAEESIRAGGDATFARKARPMRE